MRRIIALLLIAIVAGACGTPNGKPNGPTVTQPSTATPTETPTPTETVTPAPEVIITPAQLAGLSADYTFDKGTLTYADPKTRAQETAFTTAGEKIVIQTAYGAKEVDPTLVRTVDPKGLSSFILTAASPDNPSQTDYLFLPKTGEWVTPLEIRGDDENPVPITFDDVYNGRLSLSLHLAYANGVLHNFPEDTPLVPVIQEADGAIIIDPFKPTSIPNLSEDQTPYIPFVGLIKNPFNEGKDARIYTYAISVEKGNVRFFNLWFYEFKKDTHKISYPPTRVSAREAFPSILATADWAIKYRSYLPEEVHLEDVYAQHSPEDYVRQWGKT